MDTEVPDDVCNSKGCVISIDEYLMLLSRLYACASEISGDSSTFDESESDVESDEGGERSVRADGSGQKGAGQMPVLSISSAQRLLVAIEAHYVISSTSVRPVDAIFGSSHEQLSEDVLRVTNCVLTNVAHIGIYLVLHQTDLPPLPPPPPPYAGTPESSKPSDPWRHLSGAPRLDSVNDTLGISYHVLM